MPINAHPDYLAAESSYHNAITEEKKLIALEQMISTMPQHKSAENLRKNIRTRYKKLKQKIQKNKKSGSAKKGIKKQDMQTVIISFANNGKSSLLSKLTNAKPIINEVKFSTKTPVIGIMNYAGLQIQLIENPSIESDFYDKNLTNTADTLIILITDFNQLKKIEELIQNAKGKRIIVFNKIDFLSQKEKRKISANLQSKKYNSVLISLKTLEGIEQLKEKLSKSFEKIRVYTKEIGKNFKQAKEKPIILNPKSTVKTAAEKISKDFAKKIIQTKIWGPSSKFSGQKVGLKHILKDLDIIEFKTK